MLKKLTYLAVISYLIVLYGQNVFEFGSDLRKDFYFIGMSVVTALFAYILFKLLKNTATSFYLFMCIGEILNQSVFNGSYSYIEITFGLFGIIYILVEPKIKEWIK